MQIRASRVRSAGDVDACARRRRVKIANPADGASCSDPSSVAGGWFRGAARPGRRAAPGKKAARFSSLPLDLVLCRGGARAARFLRAAASREGALDCDGAPPLGLRCAPRTERA